MSRRWIKLCEEKQAEIERLQALVKDLADDLEAELDARYPQHIRKYPGMAADYERDMANVYTARRAIKDTTP